MSEFVKDFNLKAMDKLIKKNPGLIEAAVELHQSGKIPPNCYLLDYDAFKRNAEAEVREARKYDITLYYMSKQTGRNPFICKAVVGAGFKGMVTVEAEEAKSIYRYGLPIAHVGHLNQIPKGDIEYVLSMNPEVWTVLSLEAAKLVSDAAKRRNKIQDVLVRPISPDDTLYSTMDGGFHENEVIEAVQKINGFGGVRVVGVTSFPCMGYYMDTKTIRPTPNLKTIVRVAEKLKTKGVEIKQVNIPAFGCAGSMKTISQEGGTHVEPGIGLHGNNALQIYGDEPEIPSVLYTSEISHVWNEKGYLFGGGFSYVSGYGFYPDGSGWITGGNDLPLNALIGDSADNIFSTLLPVEPPGFDSLNYTERILLEPTTKVKVGDTVVMGFPTQIFATRSSVAVVRGVATNSPELLGLFDHANNLIDKHGRLLGEKPVIEQLSQL